MIKCKLTKDAAVISVSPALYPIDAIYGASYVFIDRAYIFLDGDEKKNINIYIKSKKKSSSSALRSLVGEFQNELLNYSFRDKINKSNRKVREGIIERALAVFGPQEILNEQDSGDYLKDPLGIAIPWEEKHAKPKAK
ncbi:MAG: His-Xaa-Ser system protein HxsD [Candidatus Omnitrophica bacterium]|jgi:His-Xaa-Ser system protein HxsD|nr:His-Xaa-Ser system protein HxsD [Candidatus Omnitrophota bacterium]MDD3987822.1 His-Xaa-Ser system protein HxsD [Candidatus Omnitrophota bacterium]MDD4981473.1 His-Xaa-Ser system protein HxsD [Candidatus Omnitrophota bacterium]MDD5665164.1 His-Xaa-Ser system protein HxsD [Candidatus Omnitrophota bacterium]